MDIVNQPSIPELWVTVDVSDNVPKGAFFAFNNTPNLESNQTTILSKNTVDSFMEAAAKAASKCHQNAS